MEFSEIILLPMNAAVPDNVRKFKRVNDIPETTNIKVYEGKTPDADNHESTVQDFESYGNGFVCYLSDGSEANTRIHIIAEVTPLEGIPVEINSKAPEVPEIDSKAPEIDSKIDPADELIQAVENAIARFKQVNTQTRSGGRRKNRRTFRKK